MINVVVKLRVKSFTQLEIFERKASGIMKKHHGRIVCAFELSHNLDGTGEELHVLEFLDNTSFDDYRGDPEFDKLAELRNSAILKTDIMVALRKKDY